MPIQITISGDTATEALRELQGLSAGFSGPVHALNFASAGRGPLAEEVPLGEERSFPEAKPARKPRAPKQVETAPAETPETEAEREAEADAMAETPATVEAAEEAVAADQVFTLDDARKALGDLLAQPNGKDKAKAVFAEFSATKISDIAEGQIKGFIAAIAKQRGL